MIKLLLKLLTQSGWLLSGLMLTLALLYQQFEPQPTIAQTNLAQSTTQLESRVSRLESENTTLRSQISQLQNSVSRLSRNTGVELPPAPISTSVSGSGLADDPVFKRLATLVIELKERVVAVEEELSSLGRSTAPR
ncbi:MAG: hypothetical protein HY785_04170 [Oscillatoriophycideae cyanobacterium NC_groundwater_1537_Pr4_S-0.65um_50_18]|nr:hypothetical protein [Oscillatoriophycideae cyanobacterium NC_groundwater_1537_Pr4_S-0.65um_50_18]